MIIELIAATILICIVAYGMRRIEFLKAENERLTNCHKEYNAVLGAHEAAFNSTAEDHSQLQHEFKSLKDENAKVDRQCKRWQGVAEQRLEKIDKLRRDIKDNDARYETARNDLLSHNQSLNTGLNISRDLARTRLIKLNKVEVSVISLAKENDKLKAQLVDKDAIIVQSNQESMKLIGENKLLSQAYSDYHLKLIIASKALTDANARLASLDTAVAPLDGGEPELSGEYQCLDYTDPNAPFTKVIKNDPPRGNYTSIYLLDHYSKMSGNTNRFLVYYDNNSKGRWLRIAYAGAGGYEAALNLEYLKLGEYGVDEALAKFMGLGQKEMKQLYNKALLQAIQVGYIKDIIKCSIDQKSEAYYLGKSHDDYDLWYFENKVCQQIWVQWMGESEQVRYNQFDLKHGRQCGYWPHDDTGAIMAMIETAKKRAKGQGLIA